MADSHARSPVTAEASSVSLCRADWRFLLPLPAAGPFAHAVLLGGAPGLSRSLLDAGFARTISRSLPRDRSANAVIVLHDETAAVDLARASAALAPGGVLYVEVDRRRTGCRLWTPARISRRLTALGLRTVGHYWAVPGFSRTKRFIPLDASSAVEWYLDTAYRQFSWTRRLAALATRIWLRADRSAPAFFAPSFSVIAVERSAVRTAPSILEDLRPTAGIDSHAPVALVTSGQDEGSRVVLLPFRNGERPSAVLKVARTPAFNDHTFHEHETLRQIHAGLPPQLRRTIPSPYGRELWRGLAVSIEEYAQGRTMLASTGRSGTAAADQIEDLRTATDWLIRFHRQFPRAERDWTADDLDRWLGEMFERYTRTCSLDSQNERLFDMTRAAARRLGEAGIPIVLQHDDFGPWNVHRSSAGIAVIDWESVGTPDGRFGPALMDLVYFGVHWFFTATRVHDWAAHPRAFSAVLCDHPSSRVRAVHEAFATYMAALMIPPAFLPIAHVATWVRRAVDREARCGASGAPNQYAALVAVLAGHADRLFPSS